MRIRFWGTRGSIAKAGPSTVRYGGNTSCVELSSASGTTVVLDCGTGAHGLGHSLLQRGRAQRGHVLISHTHWDHIQGLPFFAPFFKQGNRWDIYGPQGLGASLQDVLAGQMEFTYFPITPDQFGAQVDYHDLREGTFALGDIQVTARYLNHPALTLGYRFEVDGRTVVYCTDHEPHDHRLACGGAPTAGSEDEAHGQFLSEADLVIHDAQYTADEYPEHRGWGHSTVEYVSDLACRAGARRLALFHHDPMRTDDAVDALIEGARSRVEARPARPHVMGAAEGREVDLGGEPGLSRSVVVQAAASMPTSRRAPGSRWHPAPPRKDEAARQQAVDRLHLSRRAEERFDRHTRIARALFGVKHASINLIDGAHQWTKSTTREHAPDQPRELSLCDHALTRPELVFQITDAPRDNLFGDHPDVTEGLLRFYAGAPIHVGGQAVGTLCLGDDRPRHLSEEQEGMLQDMAALVAEELGRPVQLGSTQ